MSEYNAYGELYDQKPELVVHDRLRNSGTAIELIALAKQNNFKVSFSRDPFRHDLLIKEQGQSTERPLSYTLASGMRYFKKLGGA